MSITDITDQFEGVSAYNRIYRSDSGYTVKVRVQQMATGEPGRLTFVITGSLCDDLTGQARSFGEDGYFIVEPHELTVHSDAETVDLASLVEDERHHVVRRVERAEINRVAAQGLSGVLLV